MSNIGQSGVWHESLEVSEDETLTKETRDFDDKKDETLLKDEDDQLNRASLSSAPQEHVVEETPSRPVKADSKEFLDPVQLTQLSKSFFVSDTMDEESIIIPPTPGDVPFVVPSTPPENVIKDTVEAPSELGDKSDLEKQDEIETVPVSYDKSCENETGVIDIYKKTIEPAANDTIDVSSENINPTCSEEDDDWDLRFTDTQATPSLENIATVILKNDEKNESSDLEETQDLGLFEHHDTKEKKNPRTSPLDKGLPHLIPDDDSPDESYDLPPTQKNPAFFEKKETDVGSSYGSSDDEENEIAPSPPLAAVASSPLRPQPTVITASPRIQLPVTSTTLSSQADIQIISTNLPQAPLTVVSANSPQAEQTTIPASLPETEPIMVSTSPPPAELTVVPASPPQVELTVVPHSLPQTELIVVPPSPPQAELTVIPPSPPQAELTVVPPSPPQVHSTIVVPTSPPQVHSTIVVPTSPLQVHSTVVVPTSPPQVHSTVVVPTSPPQVHSTAVVPTSPLQAQPTGIPASPLQSQQTLAPASSEQDQQTIVPASSQQDQQTIVPASSQQDQQTIPASSSRAQRTVAPSRIRGTQQLIIIRSDTNHSDAFVPDSEGEIDSETTDHGPLFVPDTETQTNTQAPDHDFLLVPDAKSIEAKMGSLSSPDVKTTDAKTIIENVEIQETESLTTEFIPHSEHIDSLEGMEAHGKTGDVETSIEKDKVECSSHPISKIEKEQADETQMLPPSFVYKKFQRMVSTPHKKEVVSDSSLEKTFVESKEVSIYESSESKSSALLSTRVIGSFTAADGLDQLLQSLGISMESEKLRNLLSSACDTGETEVYKGIYKVLIKDNKVVEQFFGPEHGKLLQNISEVEVSPANSTSTVSHKTSSFSSLPSGEMGDISCSATSKSLCSSNSSGLSSQSNIRQSMPSQDAAMDVIAFRTSTQETAATSFQNVTSKTLQQFGDKKSSQEDFRTPIVMVSPMKMPEDQTSFKKLDSGVKSKKGKLLRKALLKESFASPDAFGSESGKGLQKRRRTKSTKINSSADSSASEPISKSARKYPGKRKPASETRRKNSRKALDNEEEKFGSGAIGDKRQELVPEMIEDPSTDPAPFGSILPGVRVMARWKDGYYYPGIVQRQDVNNRWWVQFDDGTLRTISQENLLKISLLQSGTSVFAESSDGYYDPGIVSAHYRDGKEVGYVIEFETGLIKRYPRSSVILSTDQAKLITNTRPVAPPSLTINLDNIVGGKRKRKSAQSSDGESSPNIKRFRSKRNSRPDSNLDSTESSKNDEILSEKKIIKRVKSQLNEDDKPLALRQRTRAKQTCGTRSASKKGVKANSDTSKSSETSASGKKSEKSSSRGKPMSYDKDSVLVKSGKLFQGYAFLLSQSNRKPEDSDKSDSDYDPNEFCHPGVQPFDKEQLCKQIMAEGGMVLESFEDIQNYNPRKVILLANTYLRTIKYIQCVAAGVPCIKYFWIHNYLLKETVKNGDFKSYILPTGYSIIDETVIEWHGKTDVFRGLKIVLTADKKDKTDFVNIWTPVLLAAKADIVQKWSLPSFAVPGMSFSVDVVITNASCPKNIIDAAKRRKLPIVSSEWLIQCIITGKKLLYDAHPKFKHDYKG